MLAPDRGKALRRFAPDEAVRLEVEDDISTDSLELIREELDLRADDDPDVPGEGVLIAALAGC